MRKKLSIIIPVFNEEKTVAEIIKRVYQVKLPKGFDKEVIAVNDGSKDSSKFKVQSLKLKGIKLISHSMNLGKGAAIKSGLKVVNGDYVIIQDADLEYDPYYYQKLLRPILENKARVVYGTRLINYPLKFWGKDKTVLPTHLIANTFLTFLTNILYGANLTDMETGYKIIDAKLLKKINLKSKKFDFEPEITAKILKLGIPIIEIPIRVTPRTYKEGKKISLIDGLIAVWTLIRYRFAD